MELSDSVMKDISARVRVFCDDVIPVGLECKLHSVAADTLFELYAGDEKTTLCIGSG